MYFVIPHPRIYKKRACLLTFAKSYGNLQLCLSSCVLCGIKNHGRHCLRYTVFSWSNFAMCFAVSLHLSAAKPNCKHENVVKIHRGCIGDG